MAVFLLLPSCWPAPSESASTLRAIAGEAHELMSRPGSDWLASQPAYQLPPVIAALKPDFISVHDDGIDIVTTAFFDGGWGYYVPRSPQPSPGQLFRHRNLGHGVYWFHPY
ncbi:hypothetical protein [Sphingomonas sp.]|uniref:hypothetical protein n=1 Tax=Sphingomonas sp. TaxID=28214 RepID=UPI002DD673FF|nr:hypothetical protein [Sphingomonas sp.]